MEAQNDKMLNCRGVLVGVEDGSVTHAQVLAELDELSRLLDTAGGVTVAQVIQNKSTPDPRTWIGSGKVKEIWSSLIPSCHPHRSAIWRMVSVRAVRFALSTVRC